MADDLYERDFQAWTQQQVDLLRAGSLANLDFVNLVEEIEALGRSDARATGSFIERILEHFLKIEFVGPRHTVRHWRVEIDAFRRNLERWMSPSLEARFREEVQEFYSSSVGLVNVYLSATNREVSLPAASPYTWDQILDRDWYPEPRYD